MNKRQLTSLSLFVLIHVVRSSIKFNIKDSYWFVSSNFMLVYVTSTHILKSRESVDVIPLPLIRTLLRRMSGSDYVDHISNIDVDNCQTSLNAAGNLINYISINLPNIAKYNIDHRMINLIHVTYIVYPEHMIELVHVLHGLSLLINYD